MRSKSILTRSVRRGGRDASASSPRPTIQSTAVQVFLFKVETYLGTRIFGADRPITIGRRHDSLLELTGDTVSRDHCRLVYGDGQLILEDQNSSNGTLVNRERVHGRRPVGPADLIHIGAYSLRVRTLTATSGAPVPSDPSLSEPTTRVEAILSLEGGGEASVDVSRGVDARLYEDAVRRASDSEAARDIAPAAQAAHFSDEVPRDLDSALGLRPISGSSSDSMTLDPDVEARLRDLDELIAALDAKGRTPAGVSPADPWNGPDDGSPTDARIREPTKPVGSQVRAVNLDGSLDDVWTNVGGAPALLPPGAEDFGTLEVSARSSGKLLDTARLRRGGEQYVLAHRTPGGAVAPASAHAGLRLLRINDDRTVDLVFPRDVGGHLVRGAETVMFNELSEGRKYSCLRLEVNDIATIILGEGGQAISYHIRFTRLRP